MKEEDDDSLSQQSAAFSTPDNCLGSRNRTNVTPTKSLVRFQSQRLRVYNSRADLPTSYRQDLSSTSRSQQPLHYSHSREDNDKKFKAVSKISQQNEVKVFSNPKYVVSDCWKTTSGELPVELVELFKESEGEEEQKELRVRRQKLSLGDDVTGKPLDKLSHTQEFHILTEVQKARILTVIEDAIKKLANSDFKDYCQDEPPKSLENQSLHMEGISIQKYYCKKFLLPWVIMKVMEMVVCHVIQLTFLSNDIYYNRKLEFLPVVLTYYFTLFIIIFSLVMHIVCYSYAGIQHPCYFMCVISSSILTLTTALGVLIMLCSMEYYKSFREILVLVFIAALLCAVIAELCICYIQVKNFWSRMQTTDQYYVS